MSRRAPSGRDPRRFRGRTYAKGAGALLAMTLGVLPLPVLGPGGGPAGTITVRAASGARVIIDRSPFGLTFVDPSGRAVLRELPATATPIVVPPIPQIEFGTQTPAPQALYAPLGFLVGTHAVSQVPAGQWEGNLSSVSEAGVEYSAQVVASVRRQGPGVQLTLLTDDPSGRTLLLSIAPVGTGGFRISVRPSAAAGVAAMADSFSSGPSEAFHGFGGRHNGLDQHGQEFYNWLQQENVSSGSAGGLTAPATPGQDRFMFPNGPEAAYYVQSSFVSSAGYGFLLDQDHISHWRMGSDRRDAWQTEVAAPALDYVVTRGGRHSAHPDHRPPAAAPGVGSGLAVRSPVYFPDGCWQNPVTGSQYHGRSTHEVPAPLAVLPYFFRCGTRPFASAASPTSLLGKPHRRRSSTPRRRRTSPVFTG